METEHMDSGSKMETNKVSFCIYVYIKMFRTVTKSFTEGDRGGVCLFIGREGRAGRKKRENKWVY